MAFPSLQSIYEDPGVGGPTWVQDVDQNAWLLTHWEAPRQALPGSPRFAGTYDDPEFPGGLSLGILGILGIGAGRWLSHPAGR